MSGAAEVGPADPAPGDVDPYDCAECVETGDLCPFHIGFAEGWDACAELCARMVTGDD